MTHRGCVPVADCCVELSFVGCVWQPILFKSSRQVHLSSTVSGLGPNVWSWWVCLINERWWDTCTVATPLYSPPTPGARTTNRQMNKATRRNLRALETRYKVTLTYLIICNMHLIVDGRWCTLGQKKESPGPLFTINFWPISCLWSFDRQKCGRRMNCDYDSQPAFNR